MVTTSWAMTVSTLQLFATVVLAATLIDELGLSRWQVGVLGATNTGVGALAAPHLGRLADRLGCRRSMTALGVTSAAGLILTAVAFDYWLLVAASAVAGLPQGASNPVTNMVIAEEVPGEHQGSVTGVKQSGVQFAVFLAGAVLPTAAVTIGWRWALVILGLVTLVGAAATRARFPPQHAGSPAGSDGVLVAAGRLPGFVIQVAVYAFLLGLTAGGVTRFYPLYAQEVLGYSEPAAGLAVSVAGLAAIAARLAWARAVSLVPLRPALVALAVGSAAAAGLLVASEVIAAWILWPTVILMAFTVMAWNVVAMLAVIWSVPIRESGRATGVVLMGFLGGLTVSAPLVGYAVDRFGSYRPIWITLAALALAGGATVSRASGGQAKRSRRTLPRLVLGSAWRSSRLRGAHQAGKRSFVAERRAARVGGEAGSAGTATATTR
jgi:predicted MFS family arabinose efflux permease